jgi:hypothetical protein
MAENEDMSQQHPDEDEAEAHIQLGTVKVQRCSACGSQVEHHLAYVREHGKCIV